MTPLETKFDNFLKGFYGSLDVSVDYTTKGINNPLAYNYGYASWRAGQPVCHYGRAEGWPRTGGSWLGAMSST